SSRADIVLAADLRDHDLEWCDRDRPDDAGIVVTLFDSCRDCASDAESVAAHDHELPLARFVEVGAVHRLRIFRAELEDVSDLDAAVDFERGAAARTRIAGEDSREIAVLRLHKIAARIRAAEVRVG